MGFVDLRKISGGVVDKRETKITIDYFITNVKVYDVFRNCRL